MASYSADFEGTLRNEVKLGYKAFSQLETDRQEHAGAVNDETTRRVAYTDADGAANTVRRTKIEVLDLLEV